MSARREARLWLAQRLSALVLAVCVTAHLATILYVMHEPLSTAGILERTRGNLPLACFYGAFVLAAAVHAPIGLRTTLTERAGLRGRAVDGALLALGIGLAVLGARAVWAVFAA